MQGYQRGTPAVSGRIRDREAAHLKGELSRETDSINSGVYEEEAYAVTVTPRVRTYKQKSQKKRYRSTGQKRRKRCAADDQEVGRGAEAAQELYT